ncbi:MAG: hypothetical protein AB7Q97_22395 [Gammaproteobacteria bacterium]
MHDESVVEDFMRIPARRFAPSTEVHREAVQGACTECGAHDLKRYPVLAFGGWFIVTKCQACLATMKREPWTRLGTISLPEDAFL